MVALAFDLPIVDQDNRGKVGYDAVAHGFSEASIPCVQGETTWVTLTQSLNVVRTGYAITNWTLRLSSNGGEDAVQPELIGTALEGYWVQLVAWCRPIGYTVAFDPNGAASTPDSLVLVWNQLGTLPNAPLREGWEFVGWQNANGATLQAGTVVSNLTTAAEGTVTFKAVWKDLSYTVRLNANGGFLSDGESSGEVKVTSGKPYGAVLQVPSREGWVFAGWWTGYGLNRRQMLPSDTVPAASAKITALHARWKKPANQPLRAAYKRAISLMDSPPPSVTVQTGHAGEYAKDWSKGTDGKWESGSIENSGNSETGKNWIYAQVEGPGKIEFEWEANCYENKNHPNYLGFGWTDDSSKIASASCHTNIIVSQKGEQQSIEIDAKGSIVVFWRLTKGVEGNNDKGSVWNISWTPKEGTDESYTVTFNANGGEGEMKSQTLKSGDSLPKCSYLYSDHTFKGWAESAVGDVKYNDGDSITLTKDTTLYAVWEVKGADPKDPSESKTITISFNANGGSGSMSSMDVSAGENVYLPSCKFTRMGRVFWGWAKVKSDADAGKADYADGAAVSLSETITLYAVWGENGYQVLFDKNDPAATGSMGSMSLSYSEKANLPPVGFQKTGYTFAGWATTPDGNWLYRDSQEVSRLVESDGSSTLTLYAVWTANSYSVIFDANDDSGATITRSYQYDMAQRLPEKPFTRTGWALTGWAEDPLATSMTWADGAVVSNLTAKADGRMTLYAIWKAGDYEVVFDANGGTGTMARQVFTYGVSGILAHCGFTRKGYTFAGWAISKDGQKAYDDGAAILNLAEDGVVTLYAIWHESLDWAVDASGLTLTTSGDGDWFSEAGYAVDGVRAARSAAIGASQKTELCTTVTNRGVLTFQWKVSCEESYVEVSGRTVECDRLELLVDGSRVSKLEGPAGNWVAYAWTNKTDSAHKIVWRYAKDATDSDNRFSANLLDAGWVDQVAWTPLAEPVEPNPGDDDPGKDDPGKDDPVIPDPPPTPCCLDLVGREDVAAAYAVPKAVTLNGCLIDTNDCSVAGIVQLKLGKVSTSKGTSKVSASVIGLDGKKKSSKSVTFFVASGAPLDVELTVKDWGVLKATIGGDMFAGELGRFHVQSAVVGGMLAKTPEAAFTLDEEFVFGVPPADASKGYATLTDLLPNGEPVHVDAFTGKWTCNKAASIKWKKIVDNTAMKLYQYALMGCGEYLDPAKPNVSGLKLSHTVSKGTFKGTFKVYASNEAATAPGKSPKLKKYTVNVTGVVVDGMGWGQATFKKTGSVWSAFVK